MVLVTNVHGTDRVRQHMVDLTTAHNGSASEPAVSARSDLSPQSEFCRFFCHVRDLAQLLVEFEERSDILSFLGKMRKVGSTAS